MEISWREKRDYKRWILWSLLVSFFSTIAIDILLFFPKTKLTSESETIIWLSGMGTFAFTVFSIMILAALAYKLITRVFFKMGSSIYEGYAQEEEIRKQTKPKTKKSKSK